MKRRGFLGAILAAAAAPAFVKAGSLMTVAPIWTPPTAAERIASIKREMLEVARDDFVAFVHPAMHEEMMKLAATTGEAMLYRGELYAFGARVIPSESPVTPVLAHNPSVFELTRENISRAIRRAGVPLRG